ncbi:ABC transporter permease [Neisseriaceae bacterium CLB008]
MFEWRFCQRQWRSGAFNVMLVAVILAVTAASCVAFFSTRLEATLHAEASKLMGADLVVRNNQPLPTEVTAAIAAATPNVLASSQMQSMLATEDTFAMASIHAVPEAFPLKGEHRIRQGEAVRKVSHSPAPGEVWLSERLMQQLSVAEGETLVVGDATLRVGAVLLEEAGSGFNLLSVLPNALMNAGDLPQTGLVQPGSRLTYRLFVSAEPAVIKRLQQTLTPILPETASMDDIESSGPQIQQALGRSGNFLGLATSLSVVLAVVALSLASRRFLAQHTHQVAIFRALGASSRQINRLFWFGFACLGLVGSVIGTALGYGLHLALLTQMQQLLNLSDVAAAPWWLWWVIPLVGVLLVWVLILPHIWSLKHISAQRVLRDDLPLPKSQVASAAALIAVLVLGSSLQMGDWTLSLQFMLGLAAVAAVMGGCALGLIALVKKLPTFGQVAWRQGLASLARRPKVTLVQMMALSVSILALLTLTWVKDDLLAAWAQSVPANAPNYFVLGVQEGEQDQFEQALSAGGLKVPMLYPSTRARLVAINGEAPNEALRADEDTRRLLDREFNLSWLSELPAHNAVKSGQFWAADSSEPAFSMEEGLMKQFQLKLGDTLRFDVAGNVYEAPITSTRSLNWDSFQVNFFVIGPKLWGQEAPAGYISSFYVPDELRGTLLRISKSMPHISFVDISMILAEVKSIVARLSATINGMFLLCLLATAMVIWTSLLNAKDERLFDVALMRALGASNRLLRQGLIVELALLGAFAGLVGGLLAMALGTGVSVWLFELPWRVNLWLPLWGTLIGVGFAWLTGYPVLRTVLRTPPSRILNERL